MCAMVVRDGIGTTSGGTILTSPPISSFCATTDQLGCDVQPTCCADEVHAPPMQATCIAQHGGVCISAPTLDRGAAMQLPVTALPSRLARKRNTTVVASLFISVGLSCQRDGHHRPTAAQAEPEFTLPKCAIVSRQIDAATHKVLCSSAARLAIQNRDHSGY